MLACEYLDKGSPLWGWHELSYVLRDVSGPGMSPTCEFACPGGSVLPGLQPWAAH